MGGHEPDDKGEMNMNIKQFRYAADNFSYLVYGQRFALAIDGGAVQEILTFVETHGLNLTDVTNTHSHPDHTAGTQELLDDSGSRYMDCKTLLSTKTIDLEGEEIRVYHTPGHTQDSITFHLGQVLITGDTLFNGTVGNCFTGDLKGFYDSIKLLMGFPGATIIYAGHDYVMESMAFAKKLEPDNRAIDLFLKKYEPNHVYSTMDDELKINPYLRFNESKIITLLEKKGLPVATEYERWESLMSIE